MLALHAALIGVQLAFASLAIVGKIAFRHVGPDGLVFSRVVAGALAFAIMQRATGRPLWVRATAAGPRDGWLAVGLAFLGVIINQVLFLRGLAHTTAINAVVLGSTIPVFTVAVAVLVGRERGRWQLAIGIPLALGGALYLVGAEAMSVGGQTLIGDLMIITNALSYALFLVFARPLIARHGPGAVLSTTFVVAAVVVAPLGLGDLVRAAPHLDGEGLAAIAWIAAVPTVFAYLANSWALRHASSAMVAIYIYLQPVATAVLAVSILDEKLNSRVGVASALIFAGIALVTASRPKAGSSTSDTAAAAVGPNTSS